ncbi:MADB protein [Umbelopsis sp. PMI_123]|nr:MADB protein [Umbelopsis sp. PMI_123]
MTNDDKLPHKQPAYTVRTFSFNPVSSSVRNAAQAGVSRGTLTEFTRRKNWSQRVIDKLEDFIHVLSPQEKIMYCSPATTDLFGYAPEDLIGRQISEFIHLDDVDLFRREFHEACLQRRKFHLYYRFRKHDSTYVSLEMIGHAYFGEGERRQSSVPLCFFGTGKVYPNGAANLIDSFLELKMEKELLERQINEAKAKSQRDVTKSPSQRKSSEQLSDTSLAADASQDIQGQETRFGEQANAFVDDNADIDMFPFEPIHNNASYVYTLGVTPYNDISEALQMFTGLRYDMGERSNGISTGSTEAQLLDPTLDLSELTGSLLDNSTIQVLNQSSFVTQEKVDAEALDRTSKRKKRVNDTSVVHVCTDCGTTESPEWRKGPKGPKTLCNACGLRAKKNQKASTTD